MVPSHILVKRLAELSLIAVLVLLALIAWLRAGF